MATSTSSSKWIFQTALLLLCFLIMMTEGLKCHHCGVNSDGEGEAACREVETGKPYLKAGGFTRACADNADHIAVCWTSTSEHSLSRNCLAAPKDTKSECKDESGINSCTCREDYCNGKIMKMTNTSARLGYNNYNYFNNWIFTSILLVYFYY